MSRGSSIAFVLALAAAAPAVAQDGGVAAAPDAGAAPATTGDAGVAPAPTTGDAGAGAVPWAGAQDVTGAPPPSFLDTTDRRVVDDRPPPTPNQVAALEEMEAEVDRFTKTGESYRTTVISILRREYMRQRRGRDQWYARQIREEERLQNEARERAIRLFEQFIARYPDDPTYTPDAMFRLGELYYERSAIRFQEQYSRAQEMRDRGQEPDFEVSETPDFTDTIELYKRLVRQFPDYRRIDGVYYLIGYCLNEMQRAEEARLAWLNLVCANKHRYDPDAMPATPVGETPEGEGQHPAQTMDDPPIAPPSPSGPFVDPYADCTPVREDAEFITETWFRIGEYHFDDYGDPQALDLAIAAYNKILSMPEDRNYNLALYKVAWAYYRASRYPEAIRHFSMLVDWSDRQRQETGRAGSELRPEAIQYLGIAFAYDDWNENQTPDPTEGMPTGIVRVQDTNLLPQDREWTPEVYFQLGQIYFDEAKYPQAIEVWRLALQRWPMHPRAPEITNLIARAHTRNNEMEEAIHARAELSRFGEGSQWWNSNVDEPGAQRRAEELAENALIGTAIYHHQQAQRMRRQCVAEQDPSKCQQAQDNYRLAAEAYREYLRRYPNDPQAYELRYNLADALYWAENYEEAAREYATVRDSNLDDTHLSESARRVVESLHRMVEAAKTSGQIQVREDAPQVEGTPPNARVTPIAMPQLVQRLAQAREIYLARVDDARDTENVREAYDYNNTLLLYFYGYWPQAKERFERIFDQRCRGPLADETGRVAWINLRNMAVSLGQTAEVERLSSELNRRQCTFAPDGTTVAQVDCNRPENRDEPRCIAAADITNIRYQRSLDVFRQAEAASGDEQRRLYEQAATMLVQAVNDEPSHPEAPLALEQAAVALERTSRFESAARLYQRIIDEVGPRQPRDDADRQRLDAILANAYFRLAFNANRFFDFQRAVENYRLLADAQRFQTSNDASIREKRQDALINAAIILENLQQYPQAAEYYRRAASTTTDPEIRRRATYRIAEIAFKRRNWGEAITLMRDFIQRYQSDRGAGELVVQAQWRIAQARKAQNNTREYNAALRDVVTIFGRSGQGPGSMAAEYAAQAQFELVDQGMAAYEETRINPGRPRNMEAYVQAIKTQINEASRRGQELVRSYDPIPGYRRPTWTIAAYVRQGRVYEVLVRAILNTPFVMPADLQRQLQRVGRDQREEIRIQVEDRVRQVLDEQVRPVECFAIARYALAARAARAGAIDNEYTRLAADRMQAYGEERIAECIAEAQRNDPTFGAYQTGEFTRAPRGQTMQVEAGVAPPPLASPEGP